MIQSESRIFYLDFIRAISIICILIFHYAWSVGEFSDYALKTKNFSFFASLGVSLFIILSGASLLASSQKNWDIKQYFFKRFLAIYPLFWVSYVLVFLAGVLLYHKFPQGNYFHYFYTFLAIDTYLDYKIQTFSLVGVWFIGFILLMYLIFPFLRFWFNKNKITQFLVQNIRNKVQLKIKTIA